MMFKHRLKSRLKEKVFAGPLTAMHPLLPTKKRRLHAYGVGLPRSGTHSLAYMMAASYRSRHEPMPVTTLTNIMKWLDGEITESRFRSFLRFRSKYLGCEFEASHFLHHATAQLASMYPDAKFVLTVREPVSWIESEMNQNYRAYCAGHRIWTEYAPYRYSTALPWVEVDGSGHYTPPLEAHLDYWMSHIQTVMDGVPEDRLLVVDTFDISDRIDDIASFIGADPKSMDIARSTAKVGDRSLTNEDVHGRGVQDVVKAKCQEFVVSRLPFLTKYAPFQ